MGQGSMANANTGALKVHQNFAGDAFVCSCMYFLMHLLTGTFSTQVNLDGILHVCQASVGLEQACHTGPILLGTSCTGVLSQVFQLQ